MERQLYANGTIPNVYEDPVTNLADQIGVTTEEAQRIINTMENPYKMMDMLPPNPREEFMNGGIASLRQGYGFGGFVKSITKGIKGAVSGITDAVTDFAKSDIGQIALAVAAPYALGAYVPGFATLGGSGFLGNALRAGIGNLAVQGLSTGRFDLGQAAKAGIIQGGIQTGLQRGFGPKELKTDLTTGDVTRGGEVLESTVVPDATIDFEGVQYADAAAPSVSQAAAKPVTFEQAFGKDATLSDVLKTQTPTTPQVPQTTQIPSQVTTTPTTPTTPGFEYGADVADVVTTDIGGKTYGAGQFPPVEKVVAPKGIMSVIKDETLTIPQKISEGAKNLVGMGGGDETLKQLIDQPSLSNLMTFAKNNPELIIGSASLFSALSVPKQPDESDFDYQERMALVNDYASYYGERAGVDMSGAGDIEDYQSYYSERAGVAMGGSPEVPTGEVRENPQGIMELDYRKTGGRVPIGIREKADDVPAMLSKDEFVFTSKAVKNAGNGDVDKGAERLYKVMNILENGGTV